MQFKGKYNEKDTWVTIIRRKNCWALMRTSINELEKGVRVKSVITKELRC